MSYLSHKELLEQLDYDHLTGFFKWRVVKAGVTIGSIAGFNLDGYIQIVVNGTPYLAHRLAWFYYYGYWPENQLDHIDQVRYHNWIKNIREVSNQCNQRNKGNAKNNTSGVKGVYWCKTRKKWGAVIGVNYRNRPLGFYEDFDEAVCVRLAGEQCVGWSGCDSNSPAYLYVRQFIQKIY